MDVRTRRTHPPSCPMSTLNIPTPDVVNDSPCIYGTHIHHPAAGSATGTVTDGNYLGLVDESGLVPTDNTLVISSAILATSTVYLSSQVQLRKLWDEN